MIHALTIDVEDYHSVLQRDWLNQDARPTAAVVKNTQQLLEQFAGRGVRATFFVLGEVVEAFPELIREIAAAGHELGVHGYHHFQVFRLNPMSFRAEVEPTKKRIEDLIGSPVIGHRAPAFSIMPKTSWAFDVLAEVGFQYDSSVFPFSGRRYGWPGFPRDIHRIALKNGRSIIEAPLSIVELLNRRLPACGGGYLRLFPYSVTQWAMRKVEKERPAIVYLHPDEINGEPSDLDLSPLPPLRRAHRSAILWIRRQNRHTVGEKVAKLLEKFRFAPLREIINEVVPDFSLT